jgi:hypothetical protein
MAEAVPEPIAVRGALGTAVMLVMGSRQGLMFRWQLGLGVWALRCRSALETGLLLVWGWVLKTAEM